MNRLICSLTVVWALTNAAQPARASTFRFSSPTGLQYLEWADRHSNLLDVETIMNVMEGLVETGPKGQVVPALAESWTESPDKKTYVFTLRENVKWSDGVPLRAQDFAYGWLRVLDPKTKSGYAAYLDLVENARAYHEGRLRDAAKVGVRALDDRHLEVRLERPSKSFLEMLYYYITFPQRRDLIEKFGAKAWWKPEHLVTLGPYRIKISNDQMLIFERNPLYYGSRAGPDKVRVLVNQRDPLLPAERGEIDFVNGATTDQIERLITAPNANGWHVKGFESLNTVFLAFSLADPVGGQKGFRHAVAQGLDRQAIPAQLRDGSQAATAIIPPGMPEYEPVGVPLDTKAATASLPESARRARFACQQSWSRLCQAVREALAAIELKVDPLIVPDRDYSARVREGHPSMFIFAWGADYYDVGDLFHVWRADSAFNLTGWKNPEFEKLVARAGESFDVSERRNLYASASRLLLEKDIAAIPLFHRKIIELLNNRVIDFQPFPTMRYFYFKHVKLVN